MQAYRTMMVAQSLYEGVEIPGAGLVGLITYMRTDSVRVADEAMAAVRDHIGKEYGAAYLPETPNVFRNRKSAQDAHEAIRPTSLEYPPTSLKGILNRDQLRLYELIWKRFVASQMAAAEFEQTAVDILCDPAGAPAGGYLFRASGSVPKFAGFLEVYEAADPGGPGRGRERRDRRGERRCRLQRGEARRERPAAACRGRGPHPARTHGEPALHPAAAPLLGEFPHQGAGGAGDRAAFHLRVDRQDDPGARVREGRTKGSSSPPSSGRSSPTSSRRVSPR